MVRYRGARGDHSLSIGTLTPWGRIVALEWVSGERYYWIVKPEHQIAVASLVPAMLVEDAMLNQDRGDDEEGRGAE